MTDEFPMAVRVRACGLANAEGAKFHPEHVGTGESYSLTALARLLMKYEPELAVDPLLKEAREVCAALADGDGLTFDAADYRKGDYDDGVIMCCTLAAIRRGIELGREGAP